MEKTDAALSKILTALADKFGTTVSHLYAIMIRQAYIDGFENLFIIFLFTIIAIFYWLYLKNSYTNSGDWCDDWKDYFEENLGIGVITVVLIFVFTGVFIGCSIGAIDCFCNPEYYALHQILKHD